MSDSSLLHAVAGAGAGCASLALTYPLYARMVRQQVAAHAHTADSGALSKTIHARTPASLLAELQQLLTPQGLAPHFAGLSAALWAITIQSGCYYFFFQWAKNLHGVTSSPLGNILVGSEAGIATVLLTNPLWVINSRQITRSAPVKSPAIRAEDDADSSLLSDADARTGPLHSARGSLRMRIARAASSESLGMLAAPAPGDSEDRSSPALSASPSPSPLLAPPFPAHSHSSASKPLSSSPAPAAPPPLSLSDVSFFTALRLLVAREGLAGVYSGVGPALALVSSPALQFAAYEYMKALLLRWHARAARHAVAIATAAVSTSSAASSSPSTLSGLSTAELFILGALSKVIATLLTYPIQTLKARLQRDGSPYAGRGWLVGIAACVGDMVRSEEGWPSLYNGLRAKIVQTGLTSAFLFVLRDRMLWMLVRWSRLMQAARIKTV